MKTPIFLTLFLWIFSLATSEEPRCPMESPMWQETETNRLTTQKNWTLLTTLWVSLEVDYLQFSPQGTDSNFRDGKWLIWMSQVAREDLERKEKQALPNSKACASFTALYSLSKWKWKWKSLSSVWLFVTPWTIKSLEFSRPEYWSE